MGCYRIHYRILYCCYLYKYLAMRVSVPSENVCGKISQLSQSDKESLGEDYTRSLYRHRKTLVCELCVDHCSGPGFDCHARTFNYSTATAMVAEDWIVVCVWFGCIVSCLKFDTPRCGGSLILLSVMACTIIRCVMLGPTTSSKDSVCKFSCSTIRISYLGFF